MGFALWIDNDLAWAQGLHEYRPMGVAVIGVTDLFRARDFRPAQDCPARGGPHYAGLFASLNDLNTHLRSQASRKKLRRRPVSTPAWI